jgi:hypothetical protein
MRHPAIVVGADKLVSFKTIDVTPPQPLVPFDEEARERKSKKDAKEAKKEAKKGAAKKGKGKDRRKITGGGGNAFGGADKMDVDTQMASGGGGNAFGGTVHSESAMHSEAAAVLGLVAVRSVGVRSVGLVLF